MAAASQQSKGTTTSTNGSTGVNLQKISERKSIEFLDIFDKSLDRKIWKHVQKELKRKRSFSEGEISKNYCSKVGQHGPGSKRQTKPPANTKTSMTDIERCKNKLNVDIRIQVRLELFLYSSHGPD